MLELLEPLVEAAEAAAPPPPPSPTRVGGLQQLRSSTFRAVEDRSALGHRSSLPAPPPVHAFDPALLEHRGSSSAPASPRHAPAPPPLRHGSGSLPASPRAPAAAALLLHGSGSELPPAPLARGASPSTLAHYTSA